MRVASYIEQIGTVENGKISGFVFNGAHPQIIPDISPDDPMTNIDIGCQIGDQNGNISPACTKMVCGYTAFELQKIAEYKTNGAAINIKI